MDSTETQTSVSDLEVNPTRCIACNSSGDIITFGCGHPFCRNCIKRFFEIPLKDGKLSLNCPFCTKALTDSDLDLYDKNITLELERKNLQLAYGTDCNIITCPWCQEKFLYEPGNVAGITVDPEGNPIVGEALECLKKNRCTCIMCHKNFCAECHAKPFHDGLTCHLNALKEQNIYCRFCMRPFEGCENIDIAHRICQRPDCQKWKDVCCMHILECGHPCPGLKGEKEHLECGECGFDVCCLCGEPYNLMPSIKLKCGHICHLLCAQETIKIASDKNLISLPICKYPGCGKVLENPNINTQSFIKLQNLIENQIPQLIIDENVNNDPHVTNPDDGDYYKQPEKFIRDKFAFYVCEKCGAPFYGGLKECDQEKPPEAPPGGCFCHKCSHIGQQKCPIHGDQAMVYKCFFCCRPAAFHCWGTTHFCEECHKDPGKAQRGPYMQCDGHCPFSPHPPNGTKQYFGYCRLCLSSKN